MKNLFYVASIFMLSGFLGGCASIIHGTRQQVSFNTTPEGAIVTIDATTRVTTPSTQMMRRRKSHNISIEKEGYVSQEMTIAREFSGWFLGNLIFGGIPGFIIDGVGGAMWKLVPGTINVVLQEKSGEDGIKALQQTQPEMSPNISTIPGVTPIEIKDKSVSVEPSPLQSNPWRRGRR